MDQKPAKATKLSLRRGTRVITGSGETGEIVKSILNWKSIPNYYIVKLDEDGRHVQFPAKFIEKLKEEKED